MIRLSFVKTYCSLSCNLIFEPIVLVQAVQDRARHHTLTSRNLMSMDLV